MRQLLEGHYEDVEKTAEEAYGPRAISRNSPDPVAHLGLIFALRREQGRLGELIEALEGVVYQFPHIAPVRSGLAIALLDSGRQADARRHFDAMASNGFRDLLGKESWRSAVALLAEICAALGDEAQAGRLYGLLEPYRGYCVVIGTMQVCLGPAALYLGMLAGTMGRWDEAIALFEESLVGCDALASAPWRARTQLAFARMWLARNAAGDQDRARDLLRAGGESARELAMVRVAGEIGELRARIDSA